MFAVLDREDRLSYPLLVSQLLLAPAGCFLFGMIGGEFFDLVLGIRAYQPTAWISYAVVGFVQGYLVQLKFPRASRSGGRFVWTIPFGLLVAAILLELQGGRPNIVANFLRWNPYSYNQGYDSVTFTMPACASCFYSAGVLAAGRKPSAISGKTKS